MNFKRLFFTAAAIFGCAVLWNAFVHLVLLREANLALEGIARPAAERSLALGLLQTAGIALLFVYSHAVLARRGLKRGLRHGAGFGLLAGLLVDLNQYLLYPIPASLAFAWFCCGFVEFCGYGLIAAWLYRPKEVR